MGLLSFLYKRVLKPILFRFDPEKIHHLFVRVGEAFGKNMVGRRLISAFYGYRGPSLHREVDGITYKTPVLLAAGFDYNGRLTQILESVAFGGVEVGSVTARPCPGNEPPRLRRAPKSQSLIVYKGLKNEGVDAVMDRLESRKTPPGFIVGVSIAMTNDEGSATLEGAVEDYYTSLRKLQERGVGDYYTINISCPNVHGGENFTDPNRLEVLLTKLAELDCQKPIYVKLPINAPWEEIRGLLDLLRRFKVQGVVIGNLNKEYSDLDYPDEAPRAYRGGLSGKPCQKLSRELIAKTRDYMGPDFTIIGCGGVLTPADALEKLRAGADLIQLISGMIFEGPHLMKEIGKELAKQEWAADSPPLGLPLSRESLS